MPSTNTVALTSQMGLTHSNDRAQYPSHPTATTSQQAPPIPGSQADGFVDVLNRTVQYSQGQLHDNMEHRNAERKRNEGSKDGISKIVTSYEELVIDPMNYSNNVRLDHQLRRFDAKLVKAQPRSCSTSTDSRVSGSSHRIAQEWCQYASRPFA